MADSSPIIVETDIYDKLSAEGYFADWDAFIGVMPDEDGVGDDCISVCSYGGVGVNTNQYQRPNFQILVRSKDYIDGRTKAQTILEYLMNFEECSQLSFTINTHKYILVFPWQTAPEHIGFDNKNRALFSMNFNAFVENS